MVALPFVVDPGMNYIPRNAPFSEGSQKFWQGIGELIKIVTLAWVESKGVYLRRMW